MNFGTANSVLVPRSIFPFRVFYVMLQFFVIMLMLNAQKVSGPVHTNPFSNENGAVLLRIRLFPHYNVENVRRKRSHSKTLSRVERFENDAFWKRCFLVWTEKTMLSENGDVINIDTTGRQTNRPWLSKMVDRRYHMDSISRQFRGPIYWNARASSLFEHAHWGCKSVFKTDTAL